MTCLQCAAVLLMRRQACALAARAGLALQLGKVVCCCRMLSQHTGSSWQPVWCAAAMHLTQLAAGRAARLHRPRVRSQRAVSIRSYKIVTSAHRSEPH